MTYNQVMTPFIGRATKTGSRQMMYVVTSHHMCYLLEVQDDAFDVTHQATSVVFLDRNQGQQP